MKQKIGYVALLVRDYDEAIAFYTQKLRFRLVEDTPLGEGKRWILVAPPGSEGTCLLLARASSPGTRMIDRPSGGRAGLALPPYR